MLFGSSVRCNRVFGLCRGYGVSCIRDSKHYFVGTCLLCATGVFARRTRRRLPVRSCRSSVPRAPSPRMHCLVAAVAVVAAVVVTCAAGVRQTVKPLETLWRSWAAKCRRTFAV